MLSADSTIALLEDWLKNWKTKKGLAGYSLVIIFVLGSLLLLFKELGLTIPAIWSIRIIVFFLVAHAMVWAWMYIVYPIYIRKIKIAFALEVASNDPILDELNKEFRHQLDLLNLKGEIKLIDLPRDKKFETNADAEQYSKKKYINLLIWGHTKKGELDAQEICEFKLKFTYVYPKLFIKRIEELLRSDVKLAITHRNWKIVTKNSFLDTDVIARNLTEISLFIIGLCLLLWRDAETCVQVFEKLYTCLQQGPSIKDTRRVTFIKRFERIFIEALDLKGTDLYLSDRMEEWKECMERMNEIDTTIPGVHINLAKLNYLQENMEKARHHTNRADSLIPNNPLSIINKAFFAILDRKFEKAVHFYNKLTQLKDWTMSCNTLEVILFLEDEWKKQTDNLGFLFAVGFMNYHFADKRRGKLQLRKFAKTVKKQGIQKEYSPLFIVAEMAVK